MGWRWLFSLLIPPAANDIRLFGYLPVFTPNGKREAERVFGGCEPDDYYFGVEHIYAYRIGLLFRLRSLWVGVHYSPSNRRYCINLIPCVTLWITLPHGDIP